jgi:hypothetical protein
MNILYLAILTHARPEPEDTQIFNWCYFTILNLLIIIHAGCRSDASQMKPDGICVFTGIGPSILSRGSPICSALFSKQIFKNNKFLYLYYRMLRHY